MPAPGRPRWLRIRGLQPMPGGDQRAKDRRGELRRPHKDEIERRGHAAIKSRYAGAKARLRLALVSLRRIIPRFSAET